MPPRESTHLPIGAPLAAALLALAVWLVFRGALDIFFAQEDFRGLAAAAGVLPRHEQLWRYVSVQAFMDVTHPWFGDRPWPYHAAGLGLHALNAGLLFLVLIRYASTPAAFLGAMFFATHPALFTALYWLSARADLMAGIFALLTVLAERRDDRAKWLAVPAFGACLLSKESMLLLPAVLLLMHRGRIDRLRLALLVMSAAWVAYLGVQGGPGVVAAIESPGAAYALGFGAPLLANLLTYVGWTVDMAMVKPGLRFVDAVNPDVHPAAFLALATCLALTFWPALRKRGWLVGLAAYLLLLAPVLPLANHTYRYYLYGPLLAAAFCLAILAESIGGHVTAGARRMSPRTIGVVVIACSLVFAWNGARLVGQMERRSSPLYPGLRGDPIVDRALIAERAIRSLQTADLPRGTSLRFVMRERIAIVARAVRGSGEDMPPREEAYPETNFRVALFDGAGVLALVPAVDSVSFALDLGQPLPGRRYGVYAPTGEVQVFDPVALDSLLRSEWVMQW